jgi:hypothetical protein
MLESLMHFIGICPDTHSHFDLIDLLFSGAFGTGSTVLAYQWVKFKFKKKRKKEWMK